MLTKIEIRRALRMIVNGNDFVWQIVSRIKECSDQEAIEFCREIEVDPGSVEIKKMTKRQHLRGLLSQITPAQVGRFNRMYVNIDEILPGQMDWAIQQISRTIEGNGQRYEMV